MTEVELIRHPDPLADFIELVETSDWPAPSFGSDELKDVLAWCGPVDSTLHARMLAALLSAAPDEMLVNACVSAIAELPEWENVTLDFLAAAEPSPVCLDVFRRILLRRGVDHPLASMPDAPAAIIAVYGALNIASGILMPADHDLSAAPNWLLISVESPILHACLATGAKRDDGVLLRGTDALWFERHRAVSPAFFAIPISR